MTWPTLPASGKLALYQEIAASIVRLIQQGTFRTGDRIPSVRQLSRQREVSITTVLEAYRLLESEGIIEARPQSGYFVALRPFDPPAEPETSAPPPDPTQVTMGELVRMVLRDTFNPDLVQLGAAIPPPDLLPLAKLNRALSAVARRSVEAPASYALPPGCRELRMQVARRMVESGCRIRPEEIVVTAGCQEALYLALHAVCRPGDTVAIESPIYYGVLQAIEALGLRALELPTHPRHGISLNALRYALEEHPIRACLISTFNNPLGSVMPPERQRELVQLLAEREIPLIEDDIYGDLGHESPRPTTAKAFDERGLVLLCSSFSKTLAPGYRVGWIAPGRYQEEIERLKLIHSLATATLPQLAIAEFLSSGGYDHHLRKVRRIYEQRVTLLCQGVSRHFPPGTRVTRPAGGCFVWVQLPPEIDSLRLYQQALERGITFAPGPIFSAKGYYRNFLRLVAERWTDRVETAVSDLGRLATEMGKRSA